MSAPLGVSGPGRTALAALAAASALALGSGCFVRPWAIEESERIDRLMQHEVDDAEGEAFAGICAPRWLSPVAEHAERSEPIGTPKRKKGAVSGISREEVAFSGFTSSFTSSSGKRSKKR